MKIALLLLLLQGGADEHTTDHYSIHAEGVDKEDVGRMLEALYDDLAKHFKKKPREKKLRIEVYSTRARWVEAMRKDGITAPNAGGYYHPGNKKAYLFKQPSDYFTRHLILHEATHQFHYLAATGNRNPKNGWYTEGLAEYFALHNWDGETLETGVIPAVTLEDYPAKALRNFKNLKEDLQGIVDGTVRADRPESWALIHFMMKNHEKRYRALAAKLDKGADSRKIWKQLFGPVSPKLVKQYVEWIEKNAQPYKIVWVSWQQRGKFIEGKAGPNGLAVLKKTPKKITAEMTVKKGKITAGLVFGFKSNKDFYLFQLLDGGTWRVRRYNGSFSVLKSGKAEGKTVSAVLKDGKVALHVGEKEVASFDAAGQVGLNVDQCTVHFKVGTE